MRRQIASQFASRKQAHYLWLPFRRDRAEAVSLFLRLRKLGPSVRAPDSAVQNQLSKELREIAPFEARVVILGPQTVGAGLAGQQSVGDPDVPSCVPRPKGETGERGSPPG